MPNLPDYDPGFTPELEDEDLRDIAAADRRCGPDDMLAWLQTFLAAEKRWPSLGEVRKQFGGLIGPFVACWRLKDRGDFDRLYEVVPRKTHHWQTIWLKDPYRGDDPTLDSVLLRLLQAGVRPYIDEQGQPRLAGVVPPDLLAQVRAVREALACHLARRTPERVVLTETGQVLIRSPLPGCLIEEVRHQAELYAGEEVAGEWQDERGDWHRYITKTAPLPESPAPG